MLSTGERMRSTPLTHFSMRKGTNSVLTIKTGPKWWQSIHPTLWNLSSLDSEHRKLRAVRLEEGAGNVLVTILTPLGLHRSLLMETRIGRANIY